VHRRRRIGAAAELDQIARQRNLHRRRVLVAGEHPHADAGVAQQLNRLWHAVLQLVLDRGGAEQLHLLLELGVHGRKRLLAIRHRRRSGVVARLPLLKHVVVDAPPRNQQRAQTARAK
jgi:hypothetical protein